MSADNRAHLAWVLQEFVIVPPETRFEGGWVSTVGRDVDVEGPGWHSVRQAVGWARERAPQVRLRLYHGFFVADSVVYSAGEVAVERARELSPVVVVGSGLVGHYGYMDAGRDPYVRPPLPRFLG